MIEKGAKFSPDRVYRYRLWRIWDSRKDFVFLIGLNASTADENTDDPTIRRGIGFAYNWGYGGLLWGNIFGYRNTYPETLKTCKVDPIGSENDAELIKMNSEATKTILCWGNYGIYLERGAYVMRMFPNSYHFGFTNQGQPKHPLYLPRNAKLFKL